MQHAGGPGVDLAVPGHQPGQPARAPSSTWRAITPASRARPSSFQAVEPTSLPRRVGSTVADGRRARDSSVRPMSPPRSWRPRRMDEIAERFRRIAGRFTEVAEGAPTGGWGPPHPV